MLSLQDLIDMGLLSPKVQLVEFDKSKYVELTKYEQLAKQNQVEGLVPVCDNPEWIGVDEESKFVYSKVPGKDKLGKVREGFYELQILDIEEDGFLPDEIINLALTKELKQKAVEAMQRHRNQSKNKIDKKDGTEQMIQKPQVNLGGLNAAKPTVKVDLDGANRIQTPNVNNDIQEAGNLDDRLLTSKKIQDAATFNKSKGGCLVGLITKNDAKIDVSAVAPRKSETDEKNNSAADLKQGKKLEFKQSVPGPIAGGIVRIPEGGLIGPENFISGAEKLPIDITKTNLVDKLFTAEEFYSVIGFLFNSQIPECEETYGEDAGTTIVKLNTRTIKKGTPEETTKKVPGLITTRTGMKVIHPDAYLPLKTYNELTVDSKMTQEEIDKANSSLLGKLFVQRTRNNVTSRTIDTLDGAYRNNITLEADGRTITSTYITADGPNMEVKDWYTKKPLHTINVAVKSIVEKEVEGVNKINYKLEAVNVLGKPEQENFAELNSAVNPKFEKFRNATTIDLSVATLVKTFKGATVNKKQKEAATSKENIASFLTLTQNAAEHVKNDSSWLANFNF